MVKIIESDDLRSSLKSLVGNLTDSISKGIYKKVMGVSEVASKIKDCQSELDELCNDPELRDDENLKDIYNAAKKLRDSIGRSMDELGNAFKSTTNKVDSE